MSLRAERLICLLLVLLVLVVWGGTFRGSHDWGGDFSLYVAHARNIATGQPYGTVNFFQDVEVRPQSPPTYPPLFPLLIAPVYRIWGLNYAPMKVVVQALWLLSGYALWLLARRRGLPALWAAVVTVVFLLSDTILSQKDMVLSESTYTLFSVLFLLLMEKVYRQGLDTTRPVAWGLLAGLLLILSYYARVNAVTLAAGFAAFELWRFRRIRLFAVTTGVVFLAGFVLYRLTLYDGEGYNTQFRLTPLFWLENLVFYFRAPAYLWASSPASFRYPMTLLTLVLGAGGLLRSMRRSLSVTEPAVILYMVPVLLYSLARTVRYVTPILPLFLIFGAEMLRWLVVRWVPVGMPRRALLSVVLLVLAAGEFVGIRTKLAEPMPDGPETATYQELISWVRTNTGEREVMMLSNPRVLALYTGRRSTPYLETTNQAEFDRITRKINATWIISFRRSELDREFLDPDIRARPDHYIPVWSNVDFEVYRVAP